MAECGFQGTVGEFIECCDSNLIAETIRAEIAQSMLSTNNEFRSWRDGIWSNHLMKNHARGVPVKDPLSLRRNAYRVLLTRARDGFVLYIPNDDGLETKHQGSLEETRNWLNSCGISKLNEF